MSKVVRDLRAGMGRFDALRLMADKVDIVSKYFRQCGVQAENRSQYRRDAKDSGQPETYRALPVGGEKTMEAVKLIFPLVAFIFPATFIVIGFPIGMKLWETLQ